MLQVRVSGVPGFDGDYPVEMERSFNGHELHLIKKLAGVRLGEMTEAIKAGDYDLLVAIAAISIWRAGKVTRDQLGELTDLLLDAEGGKISYAETKEDEESPPERAPTEHVSSGADDENSTASSSSSKPIGDESQETTLRAIGSRG